jgi:hypothetical protein
LSNEQARDLLEVIDERHNKKSTIVTHGYLFLWILP